MRASYLNDEAGGDQERILEDVARGAELHSEREGRAVTAKCNVRSNPLTPPSTAMRLRKPANEMDTRHTGEDILPVLFLNPPPNLPPTLTSSANPEARPQLVHKSTFA